MAFVLNIHFLLFLLCPVSAPQLAAFHVRLHVDQGDGKMKNKNQILFCYSQ